MYIRIQIILLLILIISFFSIQGQNTVVSGQIINSKTLKPIPYSGIQIEKTSIGTVTNKAGQFKLTIPQKYYNYDISFSNIGYIVQLKKINKFKPGSVIYLQPINEEIQEVIIMPDSTLFTLLERAYKKIPVNYSVKSSKLKGFYRETSRTKNNHYLYFAEAVLEIYKSSYRYKSNNDQVKIVKSVINEFSGYDTINNVRFYGGPFLANTLDVVKNKIEFINPRHFKKYKYSLDAVTTYKNNEVYIINFDTKNDTLKGSNKGKFYIDKKTLAYMAFKFENTNRGIEQYNFKNFTSYEVKERNYNVLYTKHKEKWYIKYIVYKKKGFNNKHGFSRLLIYRIFLSMSCTLKNYFLVV